MTAPASPARLPTLTEVLDAATRPASPATETAEHAAEADADVGPGSTPAAALSPQDEARLVSQVMNELQRRIDPLLEYRLREALAPALARAADLMIQEARGELAETLRDLVGRAVAQELARRRGG